MGNLRKTVNLFRRVIYMDFFSFHSLGMPIFVVLLIAVVDQISNDGESQVVKLSHFYIEKFIIFILNFPA